MRLCRRLNPFTWTRRTILAVFLGLLSLALPPYLLGLSAFASTINPTDATLKIPAIGIFAPVSPATIENNQPLTPDRQVASLTDGNKIFLYAHSTTAFKRLDQISIGDQIAYSTDSATLTFTVTNINTLDLADVSMANLTASTKEPSIILMTCAGAKIGDDYVERLIVTAKLVQD